ncbi:MAG TPA: biosynthetic-type acetolactate synthase large subunit [Oligoflexia bacterium]|nr:biosynthetic-type acetolactate synthase large subunit [Oligoflexia bacterium]HMP47146.1 biosynthetic-type acetolactate synthase large subunit [Oligoflexia bacterium]
MNTECSESQISSELFHSEDSIDLITGAEAVVRALLLEGVNTIFGYPGGAIMPFYDALYYAKDKIRHILVRHEQGAAHAAEGYAHASGKTGVCIATSGPGATNLVTGIADAMMDSVPMVCITGQVFSTLLGTDAFQETDVIGITIPITKWNYQITRAEEIPEILRKAFYIARSGRPGPVLVDITKDAQLGICNWKVPASSGSCGRHFNSLLPKLNYSNDSLLNLEAFRRAAELIDSAKKPLVLAGHGIILGEAEKALLDFAEHTGIPVACTLLGLSSFPTAHPLYAGMLGMHGNYAPNILTNEADVIIAVGMRFDDRVTGRLKDYARQAKIIHIEVDPAEIGKNVLPAVSILSDAKKALEILYNYTRTNSHPEWLSRFREADIEEHEEVIKNTILPSSVGISMGEAINTLSEVTLGESIIVADVGQHQMMAARYYKFKNSKSYITSGGLGTMGFALPAAMGAKIAVPDRSVIAVIGDGCIQMTIQELATISQEKIPVKIIVLNNNFLGMVRQWQELFFERRYSFVEMENPDYVMLCKGFRISAERVSDREELVGAYSRMMNHDGPYFLEIMVEKEQNVFPMIESGAAVNEIRLR